MAPSIYTPSLDAGIKQIFFDCDNTLMSTEEVSVEAAATVVNKVMADQNLPVRFTNEELIQQYFALTARKMIRELQKEHGFTLTREQVNAYTTYEEDLVVSLIHKTPIPCDGVHAILASLTRQKKYKLAVVSSSPVRRIKAGLVAGDIAQYFDEDQVFSANSSMPAPKPKPDPAIYQFAMQKNGVTPEQCIAFEDSRSGARSAIRAGIATVAYLGTYGAEEQKRQVAHTLMEEGCELVMDDYAQFFKCLDIIESEMTMTDSASGSFVAASDAE